MSVNVSVLYLCRISRGTSTLEPIGKKIAALSWNGRRDRCRNARGTVIGFSRVKHDRASSAMGVPVHVARTMATCSSLPGRAVVPSSARAATSETPNPGDRRQQRHADPDARPPTAEPPPTRVTRRMERTETGPRPSDHLIVRRRRHEVQYADDVRQALRRQAALDVHPLKLQQPLRGVAAALKARPGGALPRMPLPWIHRKSFHRIRGRGGLRPDRADGSDGVRQPYGSVIRRVIGRACHLHRHRPIHVRSLQGRLQPPVWPDTIRRCRGRACIADTNRRMACRSRDSSAEKVGLAVRR